MFRRKFLKLVSVFSGSQFTLYTKLRGLAPDPTINTIKLQNKTKNFNKKLSYKLKDGQFYLPLEEFAHENDFGIFTNKSKRKTVLYVGQDKAKFTANNSFIILNDQIYQYLHESMWFESELWVSAEVLAHLFKNYTSHNMAFDAKEQIFTIGRKNVNISRIEISEKANGTLIQFYCEKEFEDKEIALKITNDWLYVDVFGGKVDAASLSKIALAGIISKVQPIQFDQLVSVAFKLSDEVKSKELINGPDIPGFLINLRTSEEAAEEEPAANNQLEDQKKQWAVNTIVIDPGHGGKDPGALGYGGVQEKDIVLPISLRLGEIIKKKLPNVTVVYTRDDDTFIPLWKRTKIANANDGKLFISIHCNATEAGRARGFETYFLSAEKDEKARGVVLQENASIQFEAKEDKKRYEGINFILATMAQNAFIKQSQYLATTIQKSLALKLAPLGMKNRGVKQGPFWVMVGATMPNILVETGFISNKYEAKLLKRRSTQNAVATAIYNGIEKYKNDIENSI
ncbi:MAG: hypothetical protein GF313_05320 [Caldithrix sp.]|nr:hypothetical protein [Caldithrix sp.]